MRGGEEGEVFPRRGEVPPVANDQAVAPRKQMKEQGEACCTLDHVCRRGCVPPTSSHRPAVGNRGRARWRVGTGNRRITFSEITESSAQV